MKKTLTIVCFLFCSIMFSQTYYFSTRVKSIIYTDESGQKQHKEVSRETNNYKIVFRDYKGTTTYSVYRNNENRYWYYQAELGQMGYKEYDGKIYKLMHYYDVNKNEEFMLSFAEDKKRFIEYYNSEVVEYLK